MAASSLNNHPKCGVPVDQGQGGWGRLLFPSLTPVSHISCCQKVLLSVHSTFSASSDLFCPGEKDIWRELLGVLCFC